MSLTCSFYKLLPPLQSLGSCHMCQSYLPSKCHHCLSDRGPSLHVIHVLYRVLKQEQSPAYYTVRTHFHGETHPYTMLLLPLVECTPSTDPSHHVSLFLSTYAAHSHLPSQQIPIYLSPTLLPFSTAIKFNPNNTPSPCSPSTFI